MKGKMNEKLQQEWEKNGRLQQYFGENEWKWRWMRKWMNSCNRIFGKMNEELQQVWENEWKFQQEWENEWKLQQEWEN